MSQPVCQRLPTKRWSKKDKLGDRHILEYPCRSMSSVTTELGLHNKIVHLLCSCNWRWNGRRLKYMARQALDCDEAHYSQLPQACDNALDWDNTQSASQCHPSVSIGKTDTAEDRYLRGSLQKRVWYKKSMQSWRQIPAWFLQKRVIQKNCNTQSKKDKGEQER